MKSREAAGQQHLGINADIGTPLLDRLRDLIRASLGDLPAKVAEPLADDIVRRLAGALADELHGTPSADEKQRR